MSKGPLKKVKSTAPERRCLSCGRRDAKERLMRFVRKRDPGQGGDETTVVWDRDQRRPGRGGYVHPSLQCWARMSDAKRWRYAFRVAGESMEVQSVLVEVRNELVALTSSDGQVGAATCKFRPGTKRNGTEGKL